MGFSWQWRPKIKYQPLEIEEIFLDHLLKKQEAETALRGRKIESPLEEKNFLIFLAFETLFLLILLITSFKFQIIQYPQYNLLAQKNQFVDLKIKAERGVIYDRKMNQLIFNQDTFDLVAKISELAKEEKEKEKSLAEIAKIINIPSRDLAEKIKKSLDDLVLLKKNLSVKELILIETQNKKFSGFKIKKQLKRDYFKEESLSHILGYLGEISSEELKNWGENYEIGDYVGKEGLEKQYEKILAEEKGVLEIEKDVWGRKISQKIKKLPQSGQSLVLSLDLGLQKKISETLKKFLTEGKGKAAMAVALNPQNGEILASVSLPGFDNNAFSKGITPIEFKELNEDPRNPQLNRIIQGNYLMGSTIKPLISLAALEEDIITEKTTLFCPLKLCLSYGVEGESNCFGDWKFHGWTDIKRAIAESVNPFFYFIGGGYKAPTGVDSRLPKSFTGLGVTKITDWLKKFGWAEKTNVDLPGETQGRVPTPAWKENYFASQPRSEQIWYRGDTYNLSIGQGYILATPLQIAASFQLLANKGKIFKPRLVKTILIQSVQSDIFEKKEISPEVLKENIVSSKTLEIVRQGMRLAVSSPAGSAVSLNSLSIPVAAKTGTAQVYPQKQIYNNWITVFAPYENSEIVLTIVFENIKGLQPVTQQAAREILEWYFKNSKIKS